ncbi:hypothetical protein SSP35_01_07570 [Streptomyces sp. NBRC 110611]|uniref:hypothetical protein n=1 Tax=Streptomyces sp. NBRC 110611 TaxID=1621259 RepID=UPI0008590C73|nr:hypothetical protein [Streptomyces sp. NBRC 110611]GAU65416.1 hypothetical protein SSP35_01_07570 [Streptomyces sp. NBRC 110611]
MAIRRVTVVAGLVLALAGIGTSAEAVEHTTVKKKFQGYGVAHAHARCPEGMHVTGGGVATSAKQHNWVAASRPSDDDLAWYGRIAAPADPHAKVRGTVYALCET